MLFSNQSNSLWLVLMITTAHLLFFSLFSLSHSPLKVAKNRPIKVVTMKESAAPVLQPTSASMITAAPPLKTTLAPAVKKEAAPKKVEKRVIAKNSPPKQAEQQNSIQ